jgi:hypothetical protein
MRSELKGPGVRSQRFDFLCERIRDVKDFIMSPELEAETNNSMDRKI